MSTRRQFLKDLAGALAGLGAAVAGVGQGDVTKLDTSPETPAPESIHVSFTSSGPVYSMALGPDGKLYVGGEFVKTPGRSDSAFVRWDGERWVKA